MKMKKMLSIMLLLLFCQASFAQEDILKEGNKFYKSAQYDQAIEKYNEILNQDVVSAEVYFNLGNCYYKKKNIAQAILNFERAKKLNPDDEDLLYNLELTQQLTTDKIEVLPEFFVNSWFMNLRSSFSERQWSIASIILFSICLCFTSIFLYSKNYTFKKMAFLFGIVSFILSTILLVMANSAKNNNIDNEFAIVFAPSITLKSSPDQSGNNLFVLHQGSKVKIIDTIGLWSKISIADGNQAWMLTEDLEII